MKRLAALFLFLPLCAGAAPLDLRAAARAQPDSGLHVALVGGAGLANGLLGGHVEVRSGHLALFVGSGTLAPAISAGARVFSGDGSGLLACLHALKWVGDHSYAAGVTLGARMRIGGSSFFELGGGLAYADLPAGFFGEAARAGARRGLIVPDGNLALGYEF